MDTAEKIDSARDKLTQEMRSLVNDAEEMLKAASKTGSEQLSSARERLERSVSIAKAELASAERALLERARETARHTDEYVHDHPWTAVGVAAGVGLLVGLVLARR